MVIAKLISSIACLAARRQVIVLFCAAAVIRLAYVATLPSSLRFDEAYYQDMADHLLAGDGFTFSFSAWHTGLPCRPTSVQEPLFPMLLAGVYHVFGIHNYLAARVVQCIISSFTVICVYAISLLAFDRPKALLAGSFAAIYPPLVFFNGYLMTETLYIAFLAGMILFAALTANSQSRLSACATGVLFGLACLTRGLIQAFLPGLLVWLWLALRCQWRVRIGTCLLVMIGGVLAIAPWTIRNYAVHKAFIPVTTKGGWVLYFYTYPAPNLNFNDRWDEIRIPSMPSSYTEIQRNQEFTRLAMKNIRNNPRLMVRFAVAKLADFWNPLLKGWHPVLSLLNICTFGIATAFAASRLIPALRLRQVAPIPLLLWLIIGYYAAMATLFTGGGKARLPVEPFLIVLASDGVVALLRKSGWRCNSLSRHAGVGSQ